MLKTLLIDNYDSFTYNLCQYLFEVNGEEPDVVYNDTKEISPHELASYDNIVISPGPGHPGNSSDFGICDEIVRNPPVPLLGVCLGHQGLCLAHGGVVERADEVYHGRRSQVIHEGKDLFSGLPSPLEVVRYHSLAVTHLSPELEPLARTLDGVLMGVRHRTLPAWGVQFHPESILSQDGLRMMANFSSLTRAWQRANDRTFARTRCAPKRLGENLDSSMTNFSSQRGKRWRVITSCVPDAPEPEALFEQLYAHSEKAFWLDTSQTNNYGTGRFSYLGDATGPFSRTVFAQIQDDCTSITVSSADGDTYTTGQFLDWLKQDLRYFDRDGVEIPNLPFEFALGWVGYLGYELKAECNGARAHASDTPDVCLLFADRILAYDHHTGTVYLLALVEGTDESSAREWLAQTTEIITLLANRTVYVTSHESRPVAPPQTNLRRHLELRHGRERYLELIKLCQESIVAGESYEICLTNMLQGQFELPVWETYRYLRSANPAPFGALLRFNELSVLSTSPERFLRVGQDRTLESKPIKGTRRRGRNPEEDADLRADLASSEKDLAENLMIVDLVRNDLARCAEPGTVSVDKIFDIESYETVHQLVSTVRARRRVDASVVDCVRACFPGGSMTGAPKIRTMQIIDQLEKGPRGIYSGALGYFSLSGAADLSIVIRTMVVNGEIMSFGVGGAITALSESADEYEETAVKAEALLRLIGSPFPGRTDSR